MADELVLYTHPMSRGRIARWMMEEAGLPYRAEVVAFGPAMKAAEYRAVNPMGKVPALRHGDTVVTETAAICAYMADLVPEAGLAPPPGSPGRGAYYRWLFFGAGPLEAASVNQAMGFTVPDDKRGMAGWGSMDLVVETLDGVLTRQEWLAGPAFTAADLYVGAQIGWLMQFGVLEKRPSFEAYWERLAARPAGIRAREIDDGLVRAMQATQG